MAIPNIVQITKTYFTSEFTAQAAKALDEKRPDISKALTALIPFGLAAIISRSTSGSSGSADIFDRAKNSAINLPQFHDLAILRSEAERSNNKEDIFGNNQQVVDEAISAFAGIRTTSGATLLSWALPAMMGLIGKHSARKKLTPSGLSGYLSSQHRFVTDAIPTPLKSLEELPCFTSVEVFSLPAQVKNKVEQMREDFNAKKGSGKWFAPVIIVLAAVAATWYFGKTCNNTSQTTTPIKDTAITQIMDN